MAIKVFTALLVQDVQNDYVEGPCAVAGAAATFEAIGKMAATFERVVLALDFKSEEHVSFVCNHKGGVAGEVVETEAGPVTLMPKACVEGTAGADTPRALRLPMSRVIAILKGTNTVINSYSAFLEADRKTQTGLSSYCEDRFVNRIYLCGLNVNDSLIRTAFDALHFKIEVFWVKDAIAGIDEKDAGTKVKLASLAEHGVKFVTCAEVLDREIA